MAYFITEKLSGWLFSNRLDALKPFNNFSFRMKANELMFGYYLKTYSLNKKKSISKKKRELVLNAK